MIATSAVLGTMFGKYRLNAKLGRGGMADVYLAEDTVTSTMVALRIIEIREDSADSREMLEAERRGARLQEQFSALDPHVPRVFEYGLSDGCFFVAMEFVDGEDLAETLGRGPLRPDVAVEVTTQICHCLANAHAFEVDLDGAHMATIVHGDITPKNVRVNANGDVKLLDFGIAKALSLTRKLTRNAFGSLPYLSPERLESGDVDAHADLWSVGTLFYEMLSATRPYRAENTRKLEKLILARQPPRPLPDTCPEALRRSVAKMLHADPSRRYQTAAAIASDLIAWKHGRQTDAEREWIAGELADEATRRTRPPIDAREVTDDERTRRTSAPDRTTQSQSGPHAGLQPPPPTPAPIVRFVRHVGAKRLMRAAVWLIVIGVIAKESRVWRRADDVARTVLTANVEGLDAAYQQYQELAEASFFRIGLSGLRTRLKAQLVAESDRVIADFRQDVPIVREQQWIDAQGWLGRAVALDPSDRAVQARLRYAEGQVFRINGEARLRRGAQQAANERLRQAVQRFEEAAGLNPRWPDPYLALVRTYIYGLDDLDRALEAMRQAEQRGHQSGTRESTQLADGYKARGDRFRTNALTMPGMPQQKEYLERALDSYRRALELYAAAPAFPGVADSVRQTQQRLTGVESRLEVIEQPLEAPAAIARPPGDPRPWP